MHPENIEYGKRFGLHHRFKVCTGTPYLGGFIWDYKSKCDCLKKRTSMWEQNIHTISKTVGKYPHKSYAVVVRAIQFE